MLLFEIFLDVASFFKLTLMKIIIERTISGRRAFWTAVIVPETPILFMFEIPIPSDTQKHPKNASLKIIFLRLSSIHVVYILTPSWSSVGGLAFNRNKLIDINGDN